MPSETPIDKRTLLLNLINASCSFLNLVRFKDRYGKSYFVYKGGNVIPHEEALKDAQKLLEQRLEESGQVHVETERTRLTRDKLLTPSEN